MNNQLLNRISNSLFGNQFGTTTGGTGTGMEPAQELKVQELAMVLLLLELMCFGTLSVDIYHSNLGLVVNLLDTDTGEQTQVILPGQ